MRRPSEACACCCLRCLSGLRLQPFSFSALQPFSPSVRQPFSPSALLPETPAAWHRPPLAGA
ncbi:MAG: hypothetical protein C0503_11720 [Gemmatimonas sp.]|nr:hypothetical protein [Gemmatimonas sp.]